MANVNTQENTVDEPKTNLYNQKKSWHTPDVMPTDNPMTADSLFVESNASNTEPQSSQGEEVVEQQTSEEQSSNYKKRYDDLKKTL